MQVQQPQAQKPRLARMVYLRLLDAFREYYGCKLLRHFQKTPKNKLILKRFSGL